MSCSRVIWVARTPAAERAALVERFYAPCGAASAVRRWEDLGLAVGVVELGTFDRPGDAPPVAPGPGALVSFGERLPRGLDDPAGLLGASDEQLRALDGFHAAVACDGARWRIVGGAGAPRTWFQCGDAWATTAAAAAILGHPDPGVDPAALAELLAFGSCLGERTHLRGARALPIATVVDGGGRERSYWPREDRWADAGEDPFEALTDTLDRRLRAEPSPWLAVTAGRDSPVVAAALEHLGLRVPAFTWGEADWPDVAGGRAVAAAFRLEHRHQPIAPVVAEDEARALAVREAIWSDGGAALGGYGLPTLPAGMTAMVTGAGAEVGRAYYYHWAARNRPRPRPRHLAAVLGALARVPRERRAGVQARLLEWLEGAAAVGHAGWSALDVFYTEERMGRWGRSRVARHPAALMTPFPSPAVSRSLVALPFEDRMTLAWHRRVVGGRVALPDQRDQRRGIPPALRRAASSLRRRGAPPTPRWAAADAWDRLPGLRDWILEEPLASPVLAEGLGEEWVARLHAGLRDGAALATDQALLAAAAGLVHERLRGASPTGLRPE